MVVSNQSGWQPNANSLYTTSDLGKVNLTYSNYIAPQGVNTYNSQNTFEIQPNDNLDVYLGDRWWVTDRNRVRTCGTLLYRAVSCIFRSGGPILPRKAMQFRQTRLSPPQPEHSNKDGIPGGVW